MAIILSQMFAAFRPRLAFPRNWQRLRRKSQSPLLLTACGGTRVSAESGKAPG